MKKTFQKLANNMKGAAGTARRKTVATFQRFPVFSFIGVLAILFLLIATGNMIRKPKPEAEATVAQPKQVSVYSVGEAPRIRTQAKIEKSGVIKIVAQTGGIVQNINVKEGQEISRGSTLTHISTNYLGGTAVTAQRKIAEAQYFNARDTFDIQKDIINKQRDIANKNENNSDELRAISEKSVGETRDLISLNETILNTLNKDLSQYEATNSADVNRDAITALQQSKAQLTASLNQLRSSLRNLEYSTNSDKPQAQLSDLSKELTLKQLELQEKSLTLSKEVAHLQYNLALINESIAYPAAPCAGVVEKVHVKFGQSVNPGQVLFTISTNEKSALAVALVSRDIAQNISRIEPALISVGQNTVSVMPSYVSQEATDGSLYSVFYALPGEFIADYTNDSYVQAEIPVGYANTSSVIPYIPLDSVHQTQDAAYVYVVEKGVAKSKQIQLGEVFGQYVEVRSGLSSSDRIILDRSVFDNEKVTAREI